MVGTKKGYNYKIVTFLEKWHITKFLYHLNSTNILIGYLLFSYIIALSKQWLCLINKLHVHLHFMKNFNIYCKPLYSLKCTQNILNLYYVTYFFFSITHSTGKQVFLFVKIQICMWLWRHNDASFQNHCRRHKKIGR